MTLKPAWCWSTANRCEIILWLFYDGISASFHRKLFCLARLFARTLLSEFPMQLTRLCGGHRKPPILPVRSKISRNDTRQLSESGVSLCPEVRNSAQRLLAH